MAEESSTFARRVRVKTEGDDSSDNGEKKIQFVSEADTMLADVEYYTNKLISQST